MNYKEIEGLKGCIINNINGQREKIIVESQQGSCV